MSLTLDILLKNSSQFKCDIVEKKGITAEQYIDEVANNLIDVIKQRADGFKTKIMAMKQTISPILNKYEETINKLNQHPALLKLAGQIKRNTIVFFHTTEERQKKDKMRARGYNNDIMFYFNDPKNPWDIVLDLKTMKFKLWNLFTNWVRFDVGDFGCNEILIKANKLQEIYIPQLQYIYDNLDALIKENLKLNQQGTKEIKTGALGQKLIRMFGPKTVKEMTVIQEISDPSHWAWGDCFALFVYHKKLFRFETYDSGSYSGHHVNQIRCFCIVKNQLGKYENPVKCRLSASDILQYFPEIQFSEPGCIAERR